MQIEKEKVKILLFAGNIIYKRDSQNFTGKLLKLIKKLLSKYLYIKSTQKYQYPSYIQMENGLRNQGSKAICNSLK